jgi:hypothetical protein
MKVFGDIRMGDLTGEVKDVMYTNWLQPQCEENIDSSYPYTMRFYIPPTTKKIKSAAMNIEVARYRVDSKVTASTEQAVLTASSVTVSSAASTLDDTTSSQSTTTTVSITNSTTTGSSSKSTSDSGGGATIGFDDFNTGTPYTAETDSADGSTGSHSHLIWSDEVSHEHTVPSHSHGMTHTHGMAHQHDISHTHTIPGHTHTITNEAHAHDLTIPGHSHDLTYGIAEAVGVGFEPDNVKVYVNGKLIGTYDGITTVNDIDISESLVVGQWNTIKFTTSTFARVSCFVTAELLQKYI